MVRRNMRAEEVRDGFRVRAGNNIEKVTRRKVVIGHDGRPVIRFTAVYPDRTVEWSAYPEDTVEVEI